MRTDQAARRASHATAWLSAALLLLACAGEHSTRRGDRVIVSSYPPEIQAAYRVFAVRCSRCHTLARPLNANITDPDHWVRYVTRMRRQPTSGINRDNADIILRFLIYYANEKKREQEAGDKDEAQPAPPAAVTKAADTTEPAPSPAVDEAPAPPDPPTTPANDNGRSP